MVPAEFASFFSAAVRRQRKKLELSQERLAERANLSSKMISLIERGERTPSITVAHAIAEGLAMPLWRLIKDAEGSPRESAKRKRK